MSKVGRNRKGLRWGVPSTGRTPWRPAEATLQERYMIVKKPNGQVDYKKIIVEKKKTNETGHSS